MIPMKKTVLEVGAGCSDSQVRSHKLPWKQGCQVEWKSNQPIHTLPHSTTLMEDLSVKSGMWFSIFMLQDLLTSNLFHFIAVIFTFPDCNFSLFFFCPHSWSQLWSFSLLGLQQVSSVGYRHGGCRPSCGVTSLRGMLHVRGGRGGRDIPRETKTTRSEPFHWPVAVACPTYVVFFIKVHRCAPHLHTYIFPFSVF